MAARQTNSRSTGNQTSAAKKSTTTRKSTGKSSGSKGRNQTAGKSTPRMTKEEIAEQSAFHDEITLVVTLVVSILLMLANFRMGGFVGNAVSKLFKGIFGTIAYVVPVAAFVMVAFHISNRGNKKATRKLITGSALLLTLISFFQMLTKQYDLKLFDFYTYGVEHELSGGIIGGILCKMLTSLFGAIGTYVILIAIFLICFMMFTGKTIITAISQRSGQSLHDMRERYRENAALRQEYYQQQIEEGQEAKEQNTEDRQKKRKAKTFTLQKKPYEVDEQTGEIKGELQNEDPAVETDMRDAYSSIVEEVDNNKRKGAKKAKKLQAELRTSVDMAEIQPNVDHINISGAFVSEGEIPGYENELNEKFGKNSYGGQAEIIESDLSHQVSDMMYDEPAVQKKENSAPYIPQKAKEDVKVTESVMAEPVREAHVQIHEISSRLEHKDESSYNNEMDSYHDDYVVQESESNDYSIDYDSDSFGNPFDEKPVERTESHRTTTTAGSGTHTENHNHGHAAEDSAAVTTDDIANEIQKKEEKPYVFPPLDLLAKPKKNGKGMTEHDLKETAAKLQKTLESFGVRATITNVTCGPAVTRYEIQPEQGVKVSTITKLSDDIKLNLAATDIRIEAPIPGKAAVGIEVPNKENTAVMFRELIENKDFMEHPSDIAFAVGKDIGGKSIITDIAKMPHLLIAGATGSGKSVCINTMIMSILYKADPKDVKLIMVDPKVVELSIYNGIPHLMIPVVTDPKKASAALNWAVVEMNERYKRFADVGVRDVKSYNAKIKQVEYLNDERYKKMPQIVIIVDELADLMMVAKGEVEEAICRLAQMARAAGLHLVIATQRPSVNVITGLIKANVPSRIAFAVSSAIDSRTIIDGSGAEKLLGKGDMLFFPQGYPKPVRLQGAFISDKEVSAVVEFLSKENGSATYSSDVAEHISGGGSEESVSKSSNDRDDYFVQAGKFIIEKDKASIGMLQRVYKIGFNRAARIMDQLCEAGVVGPEEGTKPRKVIMSMEEFDQYVDEYV